MNSCWLLPLQEVVDHLPVTVNIFIRDDDAGWAEPELFQLLKLCEQLSVPIDLAAIPTAMTPLLACRLRAFISDSTIDIGIHQLGYSHVNHEHDGRKYEFGPSRNAEQQFFDIRRGQIDLQFYLGDLLDPFFTPTWNRCTGDTVEALGSLGITTLSRDTTAKNQLPRQLQELPVNFDWLKEKNGVRLPKTALAEMFVDQLFIAGHSQRKSVGILLHHEHMDNDDMEDFSSLVNCLKQSPSIQFASMSSLLPETVAAA
jgi:hypothetical protein